MGAQQQDRVGGGMEEVRQRVSDWRSTRPKLEPMPGELWGAAVSLAREHGLYRVARAVRVDYGALKDRLEQSDATAAPADDPSSSGAFAVMTLPLPTPPASPQAIAEVELLEADGSRLSIRLPCAVDLDVASVVSAFRTRAV